MENLGGRPTKYDEAYCDKVDEYIVTRNDTELPSIVGFAIYINIAKSTLYLWAKDYSRFSDSLAKIVEAQENQLINDGIYGGKEVNATIVKLLLQNNHGMKERNDVTTNDKDIPSPIYGSKATE